jgi:hypothetical protein
LGAAVTNGPFPHSASDSEQVIIDHWTFGGGTAMMLQIDHRESYDIDIFLSDPQLLSFLDPKKRDFQFEIKPSAYRGDGVGSLRLVFDGVGQIDFIVAFALTASPTTQASIEGGIVLLESIPEIVTKKISRLRLKAARYLRYCGSR